MDRRMQHPMLDHDLSRKLHRALTCGSEELFVLLVDPSMDVVRAALRNPALDENHLLALLGRRDLTEEVLKLVAGHEKVAGNHRLAVALVHNPRTPTPIALSLLPQLYLFELVNLTTLPGVTADQRLAAERAIIMRIPATPLGNRITLARRATAPVLDALMKEGDVRVVEPCLSNPRLKEVSVFQLVSSSRASAESIAAVARHQKWANRPNLKTAILRNPNTPISIFASLLSGVPTPELRNLSSSGRLGPECRRLVLDELQRRGG